VWTVSVVVNLGREGWALLGFLGAGGVLVVVEDGGAERALRLRDLVVGGKGGRAAEGTWRPDDVKLSFAGLGELDSSGASSGVAALFGLAVSGVVAFGVAFPFSLGVADVCGVSGGFVEGRVGPDGTCLEAIVIGLHIVSISSCGI